MHRTFKLDEIDCPACADKLEQAIKRVEGVENARVNFLTQKLSLTVADDLDFDEVLDRVVSLAADLEPDCEIVR